MPERTYNESFAQFGCDLAVCDRPAVGFALVWLKNQSLGGIRDRIPMALCDQHILIGHPVERGWIEDAADTGGNDA